MGKKYYITESQMKIIVSHVKDNDENVIKEGQKVVVNSSSKIIKTKKSH